ncbi:uncharacterized protein LOC111864312 [Cryptotermes secundus]|uniref:uncharacterized protein LOC111864312 n=1 Tax=Cryptotermes secundus TaxID=105785 RepID=UPI000CD7BE7B|nr:uncharacterized protein LOC111864312 [Cryptotermes secundus]XP_033607279.1 uncharacterized protein LOC111864312 [Cryptotermes secundus]
MSSLALGVPLIMVTVLGLLLNGYIMLVVVLTKQVQTANNLLLLHLGIVDSLLCALFLFFSAPSMLRDWNWLGLGTPCNLHGFLFTLLHPVALWTVCGLNCDRYYAISAPLHYGAMVSPRKVAMGLGAAWLIALILCLPPFFLIAPYSYNPGLAGCAPDFGFGDGAIWYSAIYTLLTLLLPAALILGCNIKVLMIARYHRHRIASAIFEVTLSAQVTITHQRNPFQPSVLSAGGKFRGRSAVSTVLQLLGSLLVLYFPYYGVILWESSSTTFLEANKFGMAVHVHPHVVTLASTLLTCSPPINGLLYGIKSKILRKTFQNYWRKQMSKSEMIQEIQARTPSACGSRRPSLTPLGILSRPCTSHLQRRLSEVLLDPHRTGANGPNSTRPRIQRIASELNWRPSSTSGLGISLTGIDRVSGFPRSHSLKDQQSHTVSCNTLQVPSFDNDVELDGEISKNYRSIRAAVISNKIGRGSFEEVPSLCGNPVQITRPSLSSANLFLQRVFGIGNTHFYDQCQKEITSPSSKRAAAIQTVLATTPRRSPRILITRAFSEESDKAPTAPGTPTRGDIGRQYSTSTTSLLDRKWRKMRYQEPKDVDDRREICSVASSDTESFHHLDIGTSVSSCPVNGDTHSSKSSLSSTDDNSRASSGRLYFSLDGTSEAPLCCDGVSASEGTSESGDAMQHQTQQPNHKSACYILSWPTTRRKNMAHSNGKLPPSSNTRVHLARSFTNITNTPEFVL